MLDDVMRAEIAAKYPNEACGVIIERDGVRTTAPCENVAEKPSEAFLIDSLALDELIGDGELVAVWHSHPDAGPNPSPADVFACDAAAVPFVIVGYDGERFDVSVLEPVAPRPYKGREYNLSAGDDCYGILRDYYRREYGILLHDYTRLPNFCEDGIELVVDNFAKEGFVVVDDDFQIGDVILIKTAPLVTDHIAIYSRDDTILHHRFNRLSCEDTFSGFWHKRMKFHLRHKSKC